MTDYIEVPNAALIELLQSYGGQTVVNTWYFVHETGWNNDDMTDLLGNFLDEASADLPALHDEAWSMLGARATDVRTQTGSVIEDFLDTPIPGTHAATGGLSGNAALVVTFRTALRGRSFRGRNYIGGLPNVLSGDNNHVSGSYASLCKSAYEAISAEMVLGGWTHVVVSRYFNKVARTVAAANEVTAYDVNTAIDSQRRRLAGRGE